MPIVSNPLPIKPPRDVGRDRNLVGRLWDAVESLVSLAQAAFDGRLFEWHEDEPVDASGVLIRHNLRRRPFGLVVVRISVPRTLYYDYNRWDENFVFILTGANTATLSFVLF